MNMTNFDRDVWVLHRKLHHRFLKCKEYFVRAGELLTEYRRRRDGLKSASASASVSSSQDVICLLSSDSAGDSTGDGDEDGDE
jgi:hypothetical protein